MAIHGIVQTAAIDSTEATAILGTDADRQSILFSATRVDVDDYTISTERQVTLGAGIVVVGRGGPVQITRESHGDAVTKPWYAIASTAMTIGILVASGQPERPVTSKPPN